MNISMVKRVWPSTFIVIFICLTILKKRSSSSNKLFHFKVHFKITKTYASGTRDVVGQKAQELEFKKPIYCIDDMINLNMCKII